MKPIWEFNKEFKDNVKAIKEVQQIKETKRLLGTELKKDEDYLLYLKLQEAKENRTLTILSSLVPIAVALIAIALQMYDMASIANMADADADFSYSTKHYVEFTFIVTVYILIVLAFSLYRNEKHSRIFIVAEELQRRKCENRKRAKKRDKKLCNRCRSCRRRFLR